MPYRQDKTPALGTAAGARRSSANKQKSVDKPTLLSTQVYVLRLRSLRSDDIRRLRWLLKALLRRLGLRCLSVEREARR